MDLLILNFPPKNMNLSSYGLAHEKAWFFYEKLRKVGLYFTVLSENEFPSALNGKRMIL